MTFAHPNGAARPAAARIRILGETPPPPRRRRPRWTLLLACAGVAAFGVWMTLALRPQIAGEDSPAAARAGSIEVMGLADLAARTPDERATRSLHLASPDFEGAARIAARRKAQEPITTTPVAAATAAAPPAQTTPATSTAPAPAARAPAAVGPEQPYDPTSPNSALDPS